MSESEGTIGTEELGVLVITSGITDHLVTQLINYSNNDESVVKNTSDKKRFKDQSTYNEWLKKGRKIFTLTDKEQNLLGIMWYGKEEMPREAKYIEGIDTSQYNYTFAIRLYGRARGQRLAGKFMKATFDIFMKSSPVDFRGLWLETSADNTVAVKAYKSSRFKEASTPSEGNRILMVRPRGVGTEGFGPPTSSM